MHSAPQEPPRLPDDVDPEPFVSRSQSNHLAGRFVWMTPLLTVVLALPACVALGADPGVYVMIGCLLAAVGLAIERFVSSQRPEGDPIIVLRGVGIRAGLPWWASAAVWLAVGALM